MYFKNEEKNKIAIFNIISWANIINSENLFEKPIFDTKNFIHY